MRRIWVNLLTIVGLLAFGCADAEWADESEPAVEDLVPYESEEGKFDGYAFDANYLIDDEVFVDANFLTVEQIQSFLEATPYKKRSFLAGYTDGGSSAANIIAAAATQWQINPLVLLVKLQVETSLVFEDQTPTQRRIDRAMGCGCPDNDPDCGAAPPGLRGQVECAASVFRAYLNEIEVSEQTRSGWRVDRAKNTLDPQSVRPRNAATAALYTYTPWVLPRRGGNWLFWNVYQRFARNLLTESPNHRFIGGQCESDDDCRFRSGQCLLLGSNDTGSFGVCSQRCELTCPDRRQPHTAVTFCGATEDGGFCFSRCGGSNGTAACGVGLECSMMTRQGREDRTYDVCAPPMGG